MRHAIATLLAITLLACGGETTEPEEDDKPGEEDPPPGVDPNLRIGHVMVEVGHRFETSGRAAEAGSWGLAEYQVQEILEMFDQDMTRAALPGDCNDTVADQMYENLRQHLPTLRGAASDEDATAFRERFATASGFCNGCHAGCNVAFIRVPSTPGSEVPVVAPTPEPAPAPASP